MVAHYIRLDEHSSIIKGFSTAFEEPQAEDICINNDGGRQFELNGVINPTLVNIFAKPLYTYRGGTATALTDAEREALYPVVIEPSMSLSTRLDLVEAMLNDMLGI